MVGRGAFTLRVLCASILLTAAVGKLRGVGLSASVLPTWLAATIAATELLLAAMILIGRRANAALAASLLLALAGVCIATWFRSPCGCFGSWITSRRGHFLVSCALGACSGLALALRSPASARRRSASH